MDDQTYNGWANRETWNVALWLGNTERLYRAVNALQAGFYDPADPSSLRGLGDAIRAFCERQWPHLRTPDGDSLASVDWLEIAAHWVEP